MWKAKELSTDLWEKVDELYKTGKGYKKISKELIMPVNSVQTVSNKWKIRGSVKPKPSSGRPTKMLSTTAWKIVQDAKKNPKITSAEILDSLKTGGVAVSRCTIRRHLKKIGLHGQVARRKPLLRKCHKVFLLQYAKQHRDKPQNFWKILFLFFTHLFSSPPSLGSEVKLAQTSDGKTIVCYHPSVDIPYEHTKVPVAEGPAMTSRSCDRDVITGPALQRPAMTLRSCDRDVITGPALIPTLGPEPAVDYKGSLGKPLPRIDPLHNQEESHEQVLKARLYQTEGKPAPTKEELSKMFYTTKHRWYPVGQFVCFFERYHTRRIKKDPPKDR
ncbi:unnamed protein product [Ranitomeya imitator]|uniref:Large ribosomal subunit protein mL42 n=1 Tax=Ranitomeya imitator TaxID=111125 RepID=A0ABN9LSE7_9NEOB|nr:unnamed protein product [Ranitomeya imitator]